MVSTDNTKWEIESFQPYKSACVGDTFPALSQWGCSTILQHLIRIYLLLIAYQSPVERIQGHFRAQT